MIEFERIENPPTSDVKFYGYRDNFWPDGEAPALDTFVLVKETPCGWWIRDEFSGFTKPIWVSKTALRRKAYPTQAEALKSYIARKEKQVRILEGRLNGAKRWLRLAQKISQAASTEPQLVPRPSENFLTTKEVG